MLNSLIIQNFRSLEDFEINKLGRINLIVGKNNSGKSSVLEALRIYAGNANRELLEGIAQEHDEKFYIIDDELDAFNEALPFEDLFTGRRFPDNNKGIVIGELNANNEVLTITPVYLVAKDVTVKDETGEDSIVTRRIPYERGAVSENDEIVGDGLLITKSNKLFVIDFDRSRNRVRSFLSEEKKTSCSLIPTQFISMNELAKEWDSIVLTEGEEIVKDALRIILPEFEDLRFVDTETPDINRMRRDRRRLAKVKITGLDRPISLTSMGDGMLRILQLVLKVFSAKDGILLIDEFENGLHFSVQERVWGLLFDLSLKLNIQVFATTHSWDCIESFAKVAIEKQDVEGLLFRVGQSVRNSDKGRVIATVFEKEQLFSITQSDVEVR